MNLYEHAAAVAEASARKAGLKAQLAYATGPNRERLLDLLERAINLHDDAVTAQAAALRQNEREHDARAVA